MQTITDADDTELTSATITLTNPGAGDVLAFNGAPPAGITVSSGAGEITLTGNAPLSAYQAALQQITFDGGADYILWKIERHTGVRLPASPWQRRHPLLASPVFLWRLYRLGAIR